MAEIRLSSPAAPEQWRKQVRAEEPQLAFCDKIGGHRRRAELLAAKVRLDARSSENANSPASNQEAKEAHKEAPNIPEQVVEEIAADGLVKHVTNRLGIRTCGKCHERRSQDATIQYTVNHGLILSVG